MIRACLLVAVSMLLVACGGDEVGDSANRVFDDANLWSNSQREMFQSELEKLETQKNTKFYFYAVDDGEESYFAAMKRSATLLSSLKKTNRIKNSQNAVAFGFFATKKLIGVDASARSYSTLRGPSDILDVHFFPLEKGFLIGESGVPLKIIAMIDEHYPDKTRFFSIERIKSLGKNILAGGSLQNEYQGGLERVARTDFLFFDDIVLKPISIAFATAFSGGSSYWIASFLIFVFAVTLSEWLLSELCRTLLPGFSATLVIAALSILIYWGSLSVLGVFFEGLLIQKYGLFSLVRPPDVDTIVGFANLANLGVNNIKWYFLFPMAIVTAAVGFVFIMYQAALLSVVDPALQKAMVKNLNEKNPAQLGFLAGLSGTISTEVAFSGERPFRTYLRKLSGRVGQNMVVWIVITIVLPNVVVAFFFTSRLVKFVLGARRTIERTSQLQLQLNAAQEQFAKRRAKKSLSGGELETTLSFSPVLLMSPPKNNLVASVRMLTSEKLRAISSINAVWD